MNGDINIDVGAVIPYTIDRILTIIGRDALSQALNEKLKRQIKIAAQEASWVQCVGMDHPIPIQDIYQPTRLTAGLGFKLIDIWNLLKQKTNAIIFAGPGRGKTTLLRWMYYKLSQDQELVPLLFILRWPDAVEDLLIFVDEISSGKIPNRLKRSRMVLLVDGYDEINTKERKEVSSALREFSTLNFGNFYLTCRSFYDIIDLTAKYYHIDEFSQNDVLGYVRSFSKAYGVKFDAQNLLDELNEHGLSDFASHPLMLALVCILKSGPMPQLPQNTIGLIRRAIDTLTFRWDESKGLARESRINLDGDERVRCLMRVAYNMPKPISQELFVHKYVADHLRLIQRRDINSGRLLEEIAQWYGIFIPLLEGKWTFVHRTMHDYLAARFWVESGSFSPSRVATWTARAAYAACLIPDATACLEQALRKEEEIHVLSECLYNNAPFDPIRLSEAIIEHFKRFKPFTLNKTNKELEASTHQDIFYMASNDLIESLLTASIGIRTNRKDYHDLVMAYTLAEYIAREKKLTPQALNQIRLLPSAETQFKVKRKSELTVFNVTDLYVNQ